MKRTFWLVAAVAGAIIASKLLIENVLGISLDALAGQWIASAGTGSAAILVGLLAADLFLPIPSSLVMVLSGAAFGVVGGSALSLVGSIGGEWLGFELVRRYGVNASRRIVGDDELARMRDVMARHGAAAVMVTRALPVVMETMSVVAGLSGMRRRTFLASSLAGTLPVVVVYAYAGAMSREMSSIVPAVVMLIAVAGAAWIWYRAHLTRTPVSRSLVAMLEPSTPGVAARRTVRSLEVDRRDTAQVANAIEDMYRDALDVLIVRNALNRDVLSATGAQLDSDAGDPGWVRPNEKMPVEDLQIFGTDAPATPTYQAPRGVSLDAYLGSADKHRAQDPDVFAGGFDATAEIQKVLGLFSGGRPVQVAKASDGRHWVPYTIRRIVDGKQIGIHHDYHYKLDLYSELRETVDTKTLISYVATLRAPQSGGELFVYAATSDMTDIPKLANGFSYDLAAIEQTFDYARFVMGEGDLFLLASGRCLHRVGMVAGPRARVTMGGFLALNSDRSAVSFWS